MHDLNAITIDVLRRHGVSQAFIARKARLSYPRLQRALAGAGIGWLEPEEQRRVLSTLARLGLLVDADTDAIVTGGI